MTSVTCFSCKKTTNFSDKLGFRTECVCGADLHVCKTCQFYDQKSYNECRETSADPIREKERANFCDFYQAKTSSESIDQKSDALKAAAEALFKKKPN